MRYGSANVQIPHALLGGLVLAASGLALASEITLAWDQSADPSVTGYKVYYGMTSRVYTHVLDAANETSIRIVGLLPGTTYYFAATAYDGAGLESAYSTEVLAAIPNPPVMYTVAATVSRNSAGTISGTGPYTNGSLAGLNAVASVGYRFVNWSENGTIVSSDSLYSFIVTGDRSLIANFKGPNTQGDMDFNGDGKADLATWDPATGTWFIKLAGEYFGDNFADAPMYSLNWGWAAAQPMRGDFDGDGKTDIVVYDRSVGDWYIWLSGGNSVKVHWGWAAAIPLTGDFDGDGRSDFAAYDPATGIWYIQCSGPDRFDLGQGATYRMLWGGADTTPLCGDFDGDGRTDLAAYEPSSGDWHIRFSSGGTKSVHWGWPGAVLAPGDYNGDGRTDLGVYDPFTGTWYIKYSGTNFDSFESGASVRVAWGWPGMLPVPGDYDADGISDIAVYDPATGDWHIRFSRGSSTQFHWGWNAAVIP